jgi:hypothetical protein
MREPLYFSIISAVTILSDILITNDNIKMDLVEIGWGRVDWIGLA